MKFSIFNIQVTWIQIAIFLKIKKVEKILNSSLEKLNKMSDLYLSNIKFYISYWNSRYLMQNARNLKKMFRIKSNK